MLDKIFRQGENSDIITNAHLINAGKQLAINNKSRDFFYIPRQGSQDIIAELKHLILDSLPGFFQVDPMNIQVLTPMRKYELGVENLNKRLQEILNPPNRSIPEKEKMTLYSVRATRSCRSRTITSWNGRSWMQKDAS